MATETNATKSTKKPTKSTTPKVQKNSDKSTIENTDKTKKPVKTEPVKIKSVVVDMHKVLKPSIMMKELHNYFHRMVRRMQSHDYINKRFEDKPESAGWT